MTRNFEAVTAVFLTALTLFLRLSSYSQQSDSPNFFPRSSRHSTRNPMRRSPTSSKPNISLTSSEVAKETKPAAPSRFPTQRLRSFDPAGGRKIPQRQKSLSGSRFRPCAHGIRRRHRLDAAGLGQSHRSPPFRIQAGRHGGRDPPRRSFRHGRGVPWTTFRVSTKLRSTTS